MAFKEATDELFARVDHVELASAFGVSISSIRQTQLKDEAAVHRMSPKRWHEAIIRITEKQTMHYRQLIASIQSFIGTE